MKETKFKKITIGRNPINCYIVVSIHMILGLFLFYLTFIARNLIDLIFLTMLTMMFIFFIPFSIEEIMEAEEYKVYYRRIK